MRLDGRRRALPWSAAIGWAALIGFLSLSPPEWILSPVPEEGWSAASAAAHVVEYGILAALILLAQQRSVTRRGLRPALRLAAAGAFGYGIVVELVQWPIGYRSCDPLDLVANAAGVAVAIAILSAVGRETG